MKWYYYLNKKGEENLLNNNINKDDLIICWQKENRRYGTFEDYHSFLKFQRSSTLLENCFYEILLPNRMRKIYFDIDLENIELSNIIIELKNAIFAVLDNKVSIMVFTSHLENKLSYHIILPNICLKNEKALDKFYQEVTEKIEQKYHQYIDDSVYKSTQQFRLLGSHKYGKANTKIFDKDLSENFIIPDRYEKELAKENFIFYNSLISQTTNCQYLSQFDNDEKKNKIVNIGTANEGDLEDVLNLFYGHPKYKFSYDDFTYLSTVESNGNLIITFRRHNATFCQGCNRFHDNENPFLLVKGIERDIYYYCRRKDKGGVLLGSLGQFKLPDIDIADIPIIEEITKIDEKEENNFVEEMSNKVIEKKKKYKAQLSFPKLSMY